MRVIVVEIESEELSPFGLLIGVLYHDLCIGPKVFKKGNVGSLD